MDSVGVQNLPQMMDGCFFFFEILTIFFEKILSQVRGAVMDACTNPMFRPSPLWSWFLVEVLGEVRD